MLHNRYAARQPATRNTVLSIRVLLLIALAQGAAAGQGAVVERGPGDAYKFGVFPYLSPLRLETIYAPVSAELGRALNQKVHFRTSSRFEIFRSKLRQQVYDFALIQPFWYPAAVDHYGYLPVARVNEPLTSLIMVLEDSPLRSVHELRDKVIATPPAFVPVVHMARKALREEGLEPDNDVQMKAFKSVDSCFQQVIAGAASACVAPPFAQAIIEEKMQVRLRVLLQTPSIPGLSIVVHSRVPERDRELLKRTVLSWSDSEPGKALLRRMKTQRFVDSVDAHYNVVRNLVREIKQK